MPRSLLLFLLLRLHVVVSSSSSSSSSSHRSRDDFLVTGLEEIVPPYADFDGTMYAGLLPIDRNDENDNDRHGELMFWLFLPNDHSFDSLGMWLNGGPGCSSFGAGLAFENSPVVIQPRPAGYCCMSHHEPFVYNEFAWTQAAAMLYIEQPVNVGFSHGGPDPINEEDIASDVYSFLRNFYDVFEDLLQSQLFIVGESYAGMYAPSIAHYIHQQNLKYQAGHTSGRIAIPLGGVALGNGWVDARVQGPITIDYAYWHGMIDSYTRDALHAEWEHCMHSRDPTEPEPFHKFTVPDDCSMMEGALMAAGAGAWSHMPSGPNTYDVTTWDPYSILFHNNNTIDNFFNNRKVQKAIHAREIEWQSCIPGAGRRRRLESGLLDQDRPISTLPYLAELLNAGKQVLVYNGDRDLSTCAQGSEVLLNSMQWKGADGWPRAPRGLWIVNNTVAGYTKEHLGLKFVVVYNSGHLVPFNQPAPALDLFKRFIRNQTFSDRDLPSFSNLDNFTSTKKNDATLHRASHVTHVVWMIMVSLVSFCAGLLASHNHKRKQYQPIESFESNH